MLRKETFSASLRKRRKFLRIAKIFNLYQTYVHITFPSSQAGTIFFPLNFGQGFHITYVFEVFRIWIYSKFMNTCKKNHLKVCQFCDLTKKKASKNVFKSINNQMQNMRRHFDRTNKSSSETWKYYGSQFYSLWEVIACVECSTCFSYLLSFMVLSLMLC